MKQHSEELRSLLRRIDALSSGLRPYADCVDTRALDAFRDDLTARFERAHEQHKLHIALLGQVKAGKSSFLNALLFDGEPVLPQAVFPKTAVLTRLEYAEECSLAVDFYTPGEWKSLERTAAGSLETPAVRSARELTGAAAAQGLSDHDLPPSGRRTLPYASRDELRALLAQYVGEGGRQTPLVRNVTIRMKHPALQGADITDTPGLNDPVQSRTEQARRCLEQCDAAFFLSRAGRFLDPDDMLLLTGLMPQKGLARLVLVGSLYDAALIDTIYDAPGLAEADSGARARLGGRAREVFGYAAARLGEAGVSPAVLDTLRQCETPVFTSAEIYAILRAGGKPRTERQELILRALNCHGDLDAALLRRICGFDILRELLGHLSDEQAALRARRADALIPAAESGLVRLADELRAGAKSRAARLGERRDALLAQSEALARRREEERVEVLAFYSDFLAALDARAAAAQDGLRHSAQSFALEAHGGIDLSYDETTVSDVKLFLPWTWNRSHTEVTAQGGRYDYLDTGDFAAAAERLLADAQEAARGVLLPFAREPLAALAADYLGGAEDEGTIRRLTDAGSAPPPQAAFSLPQEELLAGGRVRVRGEAEQAALRLRADEAFARICDALCAQLAAAAQAYKQELLACEASFCTALFLHTDEETRRLRAHAGRLDAELCRLREAVERMTP